MGLTPSKRASGFSTGSAAIATTVVRRGESHRAWSAQTHGVFLVIEMNEMMKTKTIGLAVALSVAAGAMCFANPNPTEGKWKLDEANSKFGEGMGKTQTVVWEKAGDEQKCTVDGVDADGKKIHTVWTGKLDGKDYPIIGDVTSDMRSFKTDGKDTLEMVSKKDGKTVGEGKIVVAADGKTRVVTNTMTNAKGEKVTSTQAYDKE
jgi:hypothetical protein